MMQGNDSIVSSRPNDEELGEVEMAKSGANKGFFEIRRSDNLRFYAQLTPDF